MGFLKDQWERPRVKFQCTLVGMPHDPAPERYLAAPDMCQFGMKEPYKNPGVYWRKTVLLTATFQEIVRTEKNALR